MRKLQPREQLFVSEYFVDFNGAAAAIRAGYSRKGASVRACKLMKRPEIAAAIAKRREALVAKVDVSSEDIIRGFARIALSDIRKLYDAQGNLKPIHELDDDTAAAIAGVEQEEINVGQARVGTVRKVKRWDAVKALEALARIKGMFNDTLTLKGDFADRLVKARERARQARA